MQNRTGQGFRAKRLKLVKASVKFRSYEIRVQTDFQTICPEILYGSAFAAVAIIMTAAVIKILSTLSVKPPLPS